MTESNSLGLPRLEYPNSILQAEVDAKEARILIPTDHAQSLPVIHSLPDKRTIVPFAKSH